MGLSIGGYVMYDLLKDPHELTNLTGSAEYVSVRKQLAVKLDRWIVRASSEGREPDSILVFGTDGESGRGALPWGSEGTEVLATISDLLDHRRLLQESDEFVEGLRVSNDRLDRERRRFAKLVLDQADALRGANADLTREVDELTRLQSLARFFAAPGPEETFADRPGSGAGGASGPPSPGWP